MLSRGLSNAIICLLFVLIVHVVITNLCPAKSIPLKTETFINPVPLSLTPLPSNVCLNNNEEKPIATNMTSEKDKLMEFVFGKKQPYNELSLDEYFKDFSKQISGCHKTMNDEYQEMCKKKSDDHRIPLSSTCDPKLQEMKPEKIMEKVQACNTTKEIHIISDYKDENVMNNGAVYGDVIAFDDSYLTFSELQKN